MYTLDGIDTQFTSKWTRSDVVKENSTIDRQKLGNKLYRQPASRLQKIQGSKQREIELISRKV